MIMKKCLVFTRLVKLAHLVRQRVINNVKNSKHFHDDGAVAKRISN